MSNRIRRAVHAAVRGMAVALAATAITVAAAAFGLVPTASAHTGLISSTPADASTIASNPPQVTLVFGDPVAPEFTAVTLTAGGRDPQTLTSRVDGATVVADTPADAPAPPDTWTIAYRVVARDGHPITGSLRFTITANTTAPTPTGSTTPSPAPGGGHPANPTTAATPTTGLPESGDPRPSRSQWGFPLAIAAFVLVIPIMAALIRRRPGQSDETTDPADPAEPAAPHVVDGGATPPHSHPEPSAKHPATPAPTADPQRPPDLDDPDGDPQRPPDLDDPDGDPAR